DVVGLGGGDGEPEAGAHAGGVGRHRQLDELVDAGEVDDLLVFLLDLGRRHAHRVAAADDVALARELAQQGCGGGQRGRVPVGVDGGGWGRQEAGDGPQERGLVGAVAADDADGVAVVGDVGDALEGVELLHLRPSLALVYAYEG